MKSIILTLLILSISFSVKSHSQGYVDMICRTMSSVETISDTTNCKYDSYNSPCGGGQRCYRGPLEKCIRDHDFIAKIKGELCHPSLNCVCNKCSGAILVNDGSYDIGYKICGNLGEVLRKNEILK